MIAVNNDCDSIPQATDAERWSVGSMLLDPSCVPCVLQVIGARDIADDSHRAVFEAVANRHRAGQPIDVGLILRDVREKVDDAAAFLAEIGSAVSTTAHAEHYASIVAESSRKRRLFDIASTARANALNGHTSQQVLNDLFADVEDLRRESHGGSQRFNAITAAQLDTGNYALSHLVDGALVEGQPCILAGPKKCLKTSLLVDLGISIAVGAPLLGKFYTPASRRFLLCSGESGLATLQETSRRVAAAKGWALADVANYLLTPELPRFDSPESIASFGDFLDGEGVEVVAIDPAYLCMPGDDAGNLFKQGRMLREISKLCQARGATLILAHHTRKSVADPYAAPELDSIAWSGFQEFARQWLLVGRREQYAPGSGQHRLWLSIGGSAGHGGLWGLDVDEGTNQATEGREWRVSIESVGDIKGRESERREHARQQRKDDREREQAEDDARKVVEAMRKIGKPETQKEIASIARIPGGRARASIVELIDSGDVVEGDLITKGNRQSYPSYRLVESYE